MLDDRDTVGATVGLSLTTSRSVAGETWRSASRTSVGDGCAEVVVGSSVEALLYEAAGCRHAVAARP